MLSGDGSMVSEKNDKLCRWKEYYSDLLNRPPASPSADELATAAAEAVPDPTIDCSPPTEEEVMMAVSRNYRGITLLSVPGKAFTRILLTRVKDTYFGSEQENPAVRLHAWQIYR